MKTLKIYSSIFILIFVNFLFCFKYTSRITSFGIYISLFLVVLQFLFYIVSHKIILPNKHNYFICFSLIFFIIGIVVFSTLAIPLESLNVDRWSVISSFFTELINGRYPYFAKSFGGNYPGPMPMYFLISFPFYLVGELSILSCLGYCIFTFYLINKSNSENTKVLLFYLFTSLYLIWEITTRSNLFTFTVLVMFVLSDFMNVNSKSNVRFYGIAILTGLMLSTRSIYILPYIIFFFSSLLNKEIKLSKLIYFLIVVLIAFIFTFVPLLCFFYRDFFIMNPFIVQSSFLIPQFYILIFVLIALFLSFFVKNNSDKYFYSGICLFISILIYAIYHLINSGYEVSFINSKIDISYFIFCIPFLMRYLICIGKVDKDELSISQQS